MNSQNLPTFERGVPGGQMRGPYLHYLNPEIFPFHIEVSISNILLWHVVIFLIYRVRFIGNYWRTWDFFYFQRFNNFCSGIATCPVAPGTPPIREGLWCHYVFHGSRPASWCGRALASPRVPWHRVRHSTRKGSGITTCPTAPDPPPYAGGL
jgi:hypothetical protein